eukprot:Rhum_TRINITY_DN9849_c0_g1::Rhum_TRINITY_DN9849_c0_g1_i1::g.35282::m.35282
MYKTNLRGHKHVPRQSKQRQEEVKSRKSKHLTWTRTTEQTQLCRHLTPPLPRRMRTVPDEEGTVRGRQGEGGQGGKCCWLDCGANLVRSSSPDAVGSAAQLGVPVLDGDVHHGLEVVGVLEDLVVGLEVVLEVRRHEVVADNHRLDRVQDRALVVVRDVVDVPVEALPPLAGHLVVLRHVDHDTLDRHVGLQEDLLHRDLLRLVPDLLDQRVVKVVVEALRLEDRHHVLKHLVLRLLTLLLDAVLLVLEVVQQTHQVLLGLRLLKLGLLVGVLGGLDLLALGVEELQPLEHGLLRLVLRRQVLVLLLLQLDVAADDVLRLAVVELQPLVEVDGRQLVVGLVAEDRHLHVTPLVHKVELGVRRKLAVVRQRQQTVRGARQHLGGAGTARRLEAVDAVRAELEVQRLHQRAVGQTRQVVRKGGAARNPLLQVAELLPRLPHLPAQLVARVSGDGVGDLAVLLRLLRHHGVALHLLPVLHLERAAVLRLQRARHGLLLPQVLLLHEVALELLEEVVEGTLVRRRLQHRADLLTALVAAADAQVAVPHLQVRARQVPVARVREGAGELLLAPLVDGLELVDELLPLGQLDQVLVDNALHVVDGHLDRVLHAVHRAVPHPVLAVRRKRPQLDRVNRAERLEGDDGRALVVVQLHDVLEVVLGGRLPHVDDAVGVGGPETVRHHVANEGGDGRLVLGAAGGTELPDALAVLHVPGADRVVLGSGEEVPVLHNQAVHGVRVADEVAQLLAGAGLRVHAADDHVVAAREQVVAVARHAADHRRRRSEDLRHQREAVGLGVPLHDGRVAGGGENLAVERGREARDAALVERRLGHEDVDQVVVDADGSVVHAHPHVLLRGEQGVHVQTARGRDVVDNLARHAVADRDRAVVVAGPDGGAALRQLEAPDGARELVDDVDRVGTHLDDLLRDLAGRRAHRLLLDGQHLLLLQTVVVAELVALAQRHLLHELLLELHALHTLVVLTHLAHAVAGHVVEAGRGRRGHGLPPRGSCELTHGWAS